MKHFLTTAFFLSTMQALGAQLQPKFEGLDAGRTRIPVGLSVVLEKLKEPTDVQFLPGSNKELVVCEKGGRVRYFDLKKRRNVEIGKFKVHTESELGVLGFAFHPRFPKVTKVYLNYNPDDRGPRRTRISEFQWVPHMGRLASERVLLEVEQPYVNHNAGQLAFGPDGFLYIGMGDGGAANDPQGNGQNLNSLLGKMLRIDIEKRSKAKPYEIPASNPFAKNGGGRPEIFAWGLRNPWRYTFDSRGRLVAADVGQNTWEEISFVELGANLGWNRMEASHCFPPGGQCSPSQLVLPFAEYGREDGISITGGYVYLGAGVPELKQKYVFGDFGTGRLWALSLPETSQPGALVPLEALGRWPFAPSTFGRDAQGEVYVADFNEGILYALVPVK